MTAYHNSRMPLYRRPFGAAVAGSPLFLAVQADAEAKAAANALKKLGGQYAETRQFTLPDSSARGLVLCRKISQTPTVYPRNGGKIAKKPL